MPSRVRFAFDRYLERFHGRKTRHSCRWLPLHFAIGMLIARSNYEREVGRGKEKKRRNRLRLQGKCKSLVDKLPALVYIGKGMVMQLSRAR